MEYTMTSSFIRNQAFESRKLRHIDDFVTSLQLPRNCNSLCLLVVADIDLPSASALAEDALCHLPDGGTLIDCICACGPFVDPRTDLQPYMSSPSETVQSSPELTHALEGLVTGCLSQLENIVCRVVWVPSTAQDPTSLFSRESKKSYEPSQQRLTPNSRNVNRQHLPLAPGLACYGLSASSAKGGGSSLGETDDGKEEAMKSCSFDEETDECISSLFSKLSSQEAPSPIKTEPDDTSHPPWEAFSATATIVLTTGVSSTTLIESERKNAGLLLHICASTSSKTKPSYSNNVLIPGSLKERGEYCLVHLHVDPSSSSSYAWQVEKVDFMRLTDPL